MEMKNESLKRKFLIPDFELRLVFAVGKADALDCVIKTYS